MDEALRQRVRSRAHDVCEYCQLVGKEAPFLGFSDRPHQCPPARGYRRSGQSGAGLSVVQSIQRAEPHRH